MRQIIIDTQTTGLNPPKGHRIVELACIEMIGRQLTGRRFHTYLNPEREIDSYIEDIIKLNNDFLSDKPTFADIAYEFVDFIRDAKLIMHYAPFDLGFLNNELSLAGLPQIDSICADVLDTLRLVRKKHPGQRNSLALLCQHYQIDHSHRTLQGALNEATLLAEVYLKMTGDQQLASLA